MFKVGDYVTVLDNRKSGGDGTFIGGSFKVIKIGRSSAADSGRYVTLEYGAKRSSFYFSEVKGAYQPKLRRKCIVSEKSVV